MIRRTFDPAFLNEVCNHPEVHPWLGHEGVIDVGPVLLNADNYALVTEGGGFILMWHEAGIYEVHSQFLPDVRGKAIEAMRQGFDYMFTRTDAHTIYSQIPDNNPAAQAMAKHARFRPLFRREDTPRGPTQYVGLTIDEWAQGNEALETDGEWFHSEIEKAVKAVNPDLQDHPHDPSHDRAVGAAVRMVKRGQVQKGMALYNRWARLAGQTPATVHSTAPVVIDVSEPSAGLICVIGLEGENMEILLCRSE